jgi:ABC-type protease/lipase transport system fused ATPase/permease subunit
MSIIVPAFICAIINSRIYLYVLSSSRRVQPSSISTVTTNGGHQTISHRDIRLLLHMMYTFAIFIIGWAPFYICIIFVYSLNINLYVYGVLAIWAEASVITSLLTLFIYNKELREFLRRRLFSCCYCI